MNVAQTTLIAACLAILIYIAVVITGWLITGNDPRNRLTDTASISDSNLQQRIEDSLDYVHRANINHAPTTVLLNGANLSSSEFLLLYDSTPFASKGHIALNVPCNPNDPSSPLFQILVGRAPELVPTTVGYLEPISQPPNICIFHTQFGFGFPVTDIALQNIAERNITFGGPHSVAISSHESYIPESPSVMEAQHDTTNTNDTANQ